MPSSRPRPRPSSRAELPEHMGLVARQLFASHGYAQVTMEQVAAQAGVSKRTLYKYFPAKEALLDESAHWCEQHADILLPYIRYKFANFDPGARPKEDRGLLPLWVMLIEAAQDR